MILLYLSIRCYPYIEMVCKFCHRLEAITVTYRHLSCCVKLISTLLAIHLFCNQETNNNLNACEQLLERYSSRGQVSEHTNLQDVSTQTAPWVESLMHMTTQTMSEQNEGNIIRIQSCESKDSATQTNSQPEVHNVGMQTYSCACSVLNMELGDQERCFQHRGQSFRLLSSCESAELGANKITQTAEWIGTKVCTPY